MTTRKRVALVAAGAAAVAGLALVLRPAAIAVEVVPTARGPLRVEVEGPGRTRVRERYVVAAPVPGHLMRPTLVAGDPVRTGDVVARIAPAAPSPIDARLRAELRARAAAARDGEAEARAALERARHAGELAAAERDRARGLAGGGAIATRNLEEAEVAAEAREHEVEMAEATLRRAGDEARAARAALAEADRPGPGGVAVRSPAAGRVLRVLQESEGPVAAGTPLFELGDPGQIEVRVDLLSTDAVRVRPGAPAEITRWGGDRVLQGTVRRVEPSAFTKVSALGVEEQRVYVLVDPAGGGWDALGDGFAVEARIVVSDRGDVPQVPASALFRRGDGWATFVADGDRARLRAVRTGAWSDAAAEIVDGLALGERVVVHPSDRLSDGARIATGD